MQKNQYNANVYYLGIGHYCLRSVFPCHQLTPFLQQPQIQILVKKNLDI
jgi:hypothetical protein